MNRRFFPRIIGFEELGNKDDFQTIVLEKRLANAGNYIFFDLFFKKKKLNPFLFKGVIDGNTFKFNQYVKPTKHYNDN